MATPNQALEKFGEERVVRDCACPKCKRSRTLVRLPTNFRCADLICDFCGYVAQVRTTRVKDADFVPRTILGAAWGPQRERMASGIYMPLFLVLVSDIGSTIYYLAADLQTPQMFKESAPSRPGGAAWHGFAYDLTSVRGRVVRLT